MPCIAPFLPGYIYVVSIFLHIICIMYFAVPDYVNGSRNVVLVPSESLFRGLNLRLMKLHVLWVYVAAPRTHICFGQNLYVPQGCAICNWLKFQFFVLKVLYYTCAVVHFSFFLPERHFSFWICRPCFIEVKHKNTHVMYLDMGAH